MWNIYGASPIYEKNFYGGSLIYEKTFYGASLILRKYYGALLTSPDKLWGISQNQKIEKCDPPPYHDLLMTAPLFLLLAAVKLKLSRWECKLDIRHNISKNGVGVKN